jgi:hypothetical protein
MVSLGRTIGPVRARRRIMHRYVIAPTAALVVAVAAGLAMASDDRPRVDVPKDEWMTFAQIADKLASDGYDVRELEIDDGAYEVEAIDADGKRFKAYLHPATGEVLDRKSDDD